MTREYVRVCERVFYGKDIGVGRKGCGLVGGDEMGGGDSEAFEVKARGSGFDRNLKL